MLRSIVSAFAMYSRLPMPHIEWKEENRRYALGFFPLIGVVIGAALIGISALCRAISAGPLIFAAAAALLPIVLTGGIHLDGYCDVVDARSSFAERERKLQIMADPHVGSFAVMHLCLYLIIQAALLASVRSFREVALIALSYVLSRSLSGLSAVSFRSAKGKGTLQSFTAPAHRSRTVMLCTAFLALSAAGMLLISPVGGAACIAAAAAVFVYYRRVSYREFGGTTGDLCGWFLQLCELSVLAAAVLTKLLTEAVK